MADVKAEHEGKMAVVMEEMAVLQVMHTPEEESPDRAVFPPRNMPYQWFSRFLGVMHTPEASQVVMGQVAVLQVTLSLLLFITLEPRVE
jgi:hypothetical protein